MGGIFAVVMKSGFQEENCVEDENCVKLLFYGTDYQDLRPIFGGLGVFGKNGGYLYDRIDQSYFRPTFQKGIAGLEGKMGLGIISDTEPQPWYVENRLGNYYIGMVGRINNLSDIADMLMNKGMSFNLYEYEGKQYKRPTEVMASLINQCGSIEEGIQFAQAQVNGSCTLSLLTEKGLFAARDLLGTTQLVLGEKESAYAISSEQFALTQLGFEVKHYLGPGEILFISPEGVATLKASGDEKQVCSMLWAYYSFFNSSVENILVQEVRHRLGAHLALGETINPDVISPLPGSGEGVTEGYSNALRRGEYKQLWVPYGTWHSGLTAPDKEQRVLVAKMRLVFAASLVQGKTVVIGGPSIGGATQYVRGIDQVYSAGAREVHGIISTPPVFYSCKKHNLSPDRDESTLAVNRAILRLNHGHMPEEISPYATPGTPENEAMINGVRQDLCSVSGCEVTSLKYQAPRGLAEAIGLPESMLCMDCFGVCNKK